MINYTIYDNGNGGKIYFNKDIFTSNSIYTIVYLKLFGGNIEQNTELKKEVDIDYSWWGNFKTQNKSTWINSNTERQLNGMTINQKNLVLLEDAIKEDLISLGKIDVEISVVSINRLSIKITIDQKNETKELELLWDDTKKEVII